MSGATSLSARIEAASDEAFRLARSVVVLPSLRESFAAKVAAVRAELGAFGGELANDRSVEGDDRAALAMKLSEANLDLLYVDGLVGDAGPTSLRLGRLLAETRGEAGETGEKREEQPERHDAAP